jgi:hypothetical protein
MKLLKTLIILLLLSNSLSGIAQINESGNLQTKIGQLIDDMPSSSGDDYAPPNATQLTKWDSCLNHLLKRKFVTATMLANELEYDLIQFTDNGNSQVYYILQTQNNASNYWGTYVFNPKACQSNLIIQAPHPRNDTNTGDQGIYIFKQNAYLFYMVAGTHRCNSGVYSSCSGTTSTCGSSEQFRESDMAHIDNSIFHKTTNILLDKVKDPYFIQLHGFSKRESDPYLILSNGVTQSPTIDYLSQLGNALVNIDPTLTFEVAHINPSIRLKGTTNTQGRLINGSNAPCGSAANGNSGRFLHIEQERTKLRLNETGWQKMASALDTVFRNLQLGTGTLYLTHWGSKDTLVSANEIALGDSLNLESGKIISLEDGFHAKNGSLFVAQVGGCVNYAPLQEIKIKKRKVESQKFDNLRVFPNPFKETTQIHYVLKKHQKVSLSIYNVSGHLIKHYFTEEPQYAGWHRYSFTSTDLEPDIYFVVLKTEKEISRKKLLFLR